MPSNDSKIHVRRHGFSSENPAATAAAAGQAGPRFAGAFLRQNGPTLDNNPTLFAVFLGDLWSSDQSHGARATQLVQFLQDLVSSSYLKLLTEYGCDKATFGRRVDVGGSSANPITDKSIRTTIGSLTRDGRLPRPDSNTMIVVFLDDSMVFRDLHGPTGPIRMCDAGSDHDWGYHYYFRIGHAACYYAVVPSLTDTCLRNIVAGGPQTGSVTMNEKQIDRQTVVASHEIVEMMTDPEPWTGWSWSVDGDNEEVADICQDNAPSTLTFDGRAWSVANVYSVKLDKQTDGQSTCVGATSAPAPAVAAQAVTQ